MAMNPKMFQHNLFGGHAGPAIVLPEVSASHVLYLVSVPPLDGSAVMVSVLYHFTSAHGGPAADRAPRGQCLPQYHPLFLPCLHCHCSVGCALTVPSLYCSVRFWMPAGGGAADGPAAGELSRRSLCKIISSAEPSKIQSQAKQFRWTWRGGHLWILQWRSAWRSTRSSCTRRGSTRYALGAPLWM